MSLRLKIYVFLCSHTHSLHSRWFLLLFTQYFALHNPHIAASPFFYYSLHNMNQSLTIFSWFVRFTKVLYRKLKPCFPLHGVPPKQKSHFSLLVSCLILLFFSSSHRGRPLGQNHQILCNIAYLLDFKSNSLIHKEYITSLIRSGLSLTFKL